MGIISALTRVAKSAVKAVSGKSVGKAASSVKRAVKAAPDFIFGTSSEVGAKAMKATKGSIFTKMKAGAKAIVKDSEKAAAKGGGFFKRLFNGIKSTPKSLKHWTKVGSRAAKAAGKSSFWGGVKGLFKGIGKKMPLIGSLVAIGFEVPNIWSAAKEEGLGTALKEAGKAVCRLAGGAVGATLGTFVGGPIGGIAGYAAGEWLVSKITGDTYSDKKDYLAEQGFDEQTVNQLKSQGYSFDDIYKEVKAAEKAAENQQTVEEPQQQVEQQPVQQQPVQQEPVQEPTYPVQQEPIGQIPGGSADPITGTTQPVYSNEQIAQLLQAGLSTQDIQALQSAGYSFEDVVAMVNSIKGTNITATPATGQTPAVGQTPDVTTGDLLEPFKLPYPMTGFGFQQPGLYNSGLYSNPYSMDIYYNMLLNDLGQMQYNNNLYNNNMTNPYLGSSTSNVKNFDNPYYKQGQLRFSA